MSALRYLLDFQTPLIFWEARVAPWAEIMSPGCATVQIRVTITLGGVNFSIPLEKWGCCHLVRDCVEGGEEACLAEGFGAPPTPQPPPPSALVPPSRSQAK